MTSTDCSGIRQRARHAIQNDFLRNVGTTFLEKSQDSETSRVAPATKSLKADQHSGEAGRELMAS